MQTCMFKSNGSGNQGFIGDFCAIDLSGSGTSEAMRVWISARNIILPGSLLKTGRTAKEQYQLRFGSQLARRRWYPVLALAPTSLFNLHSSVLLILCQYFLTGRDGLELGFARVPSHIYIPLTARIPIDMIIRLKYFEKETNRFPNCRFSMAFTVSPLISVT